jgi:hypothetical protein
LESAVELISVAVSAWVVTQVESAWAAMAEWVDTQEAWEEWAVTQEAWVEWVDTQEAWAEWVATAAWADTQVVSAWVELVEFMAQELELVDQLVSDLQG